jgi:NAD-dependent deacetylase
MPDDAGTRSTNLDSTDPGIVAVRERLAAARRVLVITGAGVSAESGIPTFRTDDGLWQKDNPLDFATREAFLRDPEAVWRWYEERRRVAAAAEPNPAHKALARLEAPGRQVLVVTQNVDDLHERAGSTDVVHVHGSLWRLRCERDGTVVEDRHVPLNELPPTCPCGNVMRPDVVWFGEALPWAPVQRVRDFLLHGAIDCCLVVGTEASFGYIVEWTFSARETGALCVEVNPRTTGLSSLVDYRFEGRAGTVLPLLVPEAADA